MHIQQNTIRRYVLPKTPLSRLAVLNRNKKRTKRKIVRISLLAGNVLLLTIVAATIVLNRDSAQSSALVQTQDSAASAAVSPLDALSSAEIADTVARLANLPETTAVQNQVDSYNIDKAWSLQADGTDGVIPKPQIVSTALKSVKDIQYYITVAGDTLSNLAVKFGVTSDSIRWSNGLANYTDTLAAGTKLTIPPVNGIVYNVKAGDTATTLAQKYGADADAITAFNDAEISGLQAGQVIVIPNGKLQSPVASLSYGNSYSGFAFGSSAIYGYNGYDAGNCTWYAANMRAKIGRPIPANLGNAITWVKAAQLAGMTVGSQPQKGAVYWVPPSMLSGYYASYGHVGFVDDVLPDGSVKISSMNVSGLYSMESKTITPAQAAQYTYIY